MRKNDSSYEMVDRSDHSLSPLSNIIDDEQQQSTPPFSDHLSLIHKLSSQIYYLRITLFALLLLIIISLVAIVLVKQQVPQYDDDTSLTPNKSPSYGPIKRIAFGSCTAYDLRNWDIFSSAIVPAQPDAWLWLGDMVYLDDPEVDCSFPNPTSQIWQESCNCTETWLQTPPFSCHAGDISYATDRYLKALSNEPYVSFLKYMCPTAFSAQINTPFPPIGSDSMQCNHGPILGVYDDHDFGWNNGNSREPFKYLFKQLYLDMIGEPSDSYRRSAGRGLYGQGMTLNKHLPGREVDVFMLDGRYERSPLPCGTRKAECMQDMNSAWCRDFLETCCTKDDEIYFGWCVRHPDPPSRAIDNSGYELWQVACNTSSPSFGTLSLAVDNTDDSLYQITPERFPQDGEDHFQDGSFCEMLGVNQRQWLRQALTISTAPVKLVLSGSVLLHNPQPYACGNHGEECYCGGDDWDCYRAAQMNLLRLLGSEEVSGCVIVLTGDYHFSDLKNLQPGIGHLYGNTSVYGSSTNVKPVWQVMASGLTSSTAHEPQPCVGYRRDPLKLRTHEECSFVTGANYGRMLLEYDETAGNAVISLIRLQILGSDHAEDVRLETVIDPRKDCLPSRHQS